MTETETAAEAARILRQHIADSRGRERITVTAARLTTVLDAVENSGHTAPAPQAVSVLRAAIQEAIDFLMERTHGSAARSPSHNARLTLQAALAATEGSADASA